MRSAIAASWALFFGIALLMLGNGLQGSLLGVRATLEGFSTGVTGVVMSGYFVGFLAASTLAPRILARVGHIRVFAALASLASTAALLHAVFVDPTTWFAMRLVTGFCVAGLYVVAESWINDRATNETRGQLLSVYMVIVMGGMGGGQLLLNLAAPAGYDLFILVSVLVSIALVPILLTVAPAPSFDAPARVGLRQLYAISPLGVLGVMGTGLSNGALVGMGAVYAGLAGLSLAEVSLFMAAAFAGAVALQWPIGRLSDRFDRRRVLTMVTFLAALAALAAAAIPGLAGPTLLALAALFGGLSFPMYALCIAHTNDYLEPEQMVGASAGLVLAAGVGAMLGPFTAAQAMALFGPAGFFWFLAAAHAAIGVFAVWRMTEREACPLDEQGPCVMMTRTTPYAAGLAVEEAYEQGEETAGEAQA
ncbi:MAG: MFS transporter [Alphaproteobacteria bacterium]